MITEPTRTARMTAIAHALQALQTELENDPEYAGMACEIQTGLAQVARWVTELQWGDRIVNGKDGAV